MVQCWSRQSYWSVGYLPNLAGIDLIGSGSLLLSKSLINKIGYEVCIALFRAQCHSPHRLLRPTCTMHYQPSWQPGPEMAIQFNLSLGIRGCHWQSITLLWVGSIVVLDLWGISLVVHDAVVSRRTWAGHAGLADGRFQAFTG